MYNSMCFRGRKRVSVMYNSMCFSGIDSERSFIIICVLGEQKH
jgi:hypothetical protein